MNGVTVKTCPDVNDDESPGTGFDSDPGYRATRRTAAALAIGLCVLLASCSGDNGTPASDGERNAVGADRDAHGCIPSAGYSWCERTHQCERPWELANQKGFDNNTEVFDCYCENPPVVVPP